MPEKNIHPTSKDIQTERDSSRPPQQLTGETLFERQRHAQTDTQHTIAESGDTPMPRLSPTMRDAIIGAVATRAWLTKHGQLPKQAE